MPLPAAVLIHSPIAVPLCWEPVAARLSASGARVIVPDLGAHGGGPPYWRRHVDAVADALLSAPGADSAVLVAHSGAGVLLPAVGERLARGGRPVAAYAFVDCDLPRDAHSRLDLFDSPEAAASFREAAREGSIPAFSNASLRKMIPDDALRARLCGQLRPVPLAVYEEAVPVPRGWPDAPCVYLGFDASSAYAASLARARREGWPHRLLPGRHFHLMVEPEAVARALLDLLERAGARLTPRAGAARGGRPTPDARGD